MGGCDRVENGERLWPAIKAKVQGERTDLPPGQVCWHDSYLDADFWISRHGILVGVITSMGCGWWVVQIAKR
jgi:hypothetical protein